MGEKETVTPEWGYALMMTDHLNSTMASAVEVVGRFRAEVCQDTAKLFLEIGQMLAQHEVKLKRKLEQSIVLARDLNEAKQIVGGSRP